MILTKLGKIFKSILKIEKNAILEADQILIFFEIKTFLRKHFFCEFVLEYK